MMESTVLEIQNLNIQAGRQVLLRNINLVIHQGEIMGLVGESGSGKTITSLSVMKLFESGTLTCNGSITLNHSQENILTKSEAEMSKLRGRVVSMIFQEPMTALNPLMPCGKQVAEIILKHHKLSEKEVRQRVLEWFNRVQLPEPEKKYDAYPHELSGGQKQRVMIAMALANKPSLIIADEPTTALDVTVQAGILQLMKDLVKQQQTSMLFISHDLAVIASLCDKVAVMYKGEIVEQGSARQVIGNPQHPYTRALLACRPAAHEPGKRLPVVADFLGDPNSKASATTINKSEVGLNKSEVLLEVKELNKSYRSSSLFGQSNAEFKAVQDVSFTLHKGETLGLVGESGCGKTTLSRTLLMLTRPDSGRILFHGDDITTYDAEQLRSLRKKIQIIFQDPYSSLNPRMSIGAAIAEVILFHRIEPNFKAAKSRVQSLLEKVGLKPEHFYRYPHEFSGGQRQRICIARALSVEPEFIICDESVSALDVSVQAQVLNLLNDLKREFHLSYLFISHDLSVVRYMSDRILVMNKGLIEEEATPEELFNNPQSEYTKRLLAAIPKIEYEKLV